jgi:hypothetical protein
LFDERAWQHLRKGPNMERRIAVTKQVMEGLSYKVVAERFDLSPSRVAAIVTRTMRDMSRLLPRDVQERAFPRDTFPTAYKDPYYRNDFTVYFATLPLLELRKASPFLLDQLTEMQERINKQA